VRFSCHFQLKSAIANLGHGMEEQLEKDIAKFQSFEIVAT